jgi:Flp pilus assembly protein TadD
MTASLALVVALFVPTSGILAAGSEDSPPTTRANEAGGSATTAKPYAPGATTAGTTVAGESPSAGALYEEGKAAISRKDWKAAIASLTKAASLEPNNADIHNLLGYSYRKTGDYKNAFAQYGIALKLNPKHKGALEYQGEAYAETGDIAKAKANLVKLKAACGNTTCEEYKDLAGFIKTAEAKAKKTKKK